MQKRPRRFRNLDFPPVLDKILDKGSVPASKQPSHLLGEAGGSEESSYDDDDDDSVTRDSHFTVHGLKLKQDLKSILRRVL